MTEPGQDRVDPLFRDEALAWAGGRRLGDVTRFATGATTILYWLVIVALAAMVAAALAIQVSARAEGSAVIDFEAGLVTATFEAPLNVGPGDTLFVHVGTDPEARLVTVDSVSCTTTPDLTITAHLSPTAGPPRVGRAYVQTGSISLVRYIVDSS